MPVVRWSLWEKQTVVFLAALAVVLPWQLSLLDHWPPDYSDKGIWYVDFRGWIVLLAEIRAIYGYLIAAQILAIAIAVVAWHRTALVIAIVLPSIWPWFVEVRWL
jgi:hypothetical protein